MSNWTDFRVKIINFFKKNKIKIFIILIITLMTINLILRYINSHKVNTPQPIVTYEPHTSIMDNKSKVPEKLQEPISKLIDKYFNYCNNGEYENAYNMISEECKKADFNTIDQFKSYIDGIFEHKNKTYNIQNFSNVDKTYIYNLNILDDVLATGTTGEEDFRYIEEKIVIKEENGELKLSIASYIGSEEKQIVVDDEYITVKILNKKSDYKYETYTVEVTNKTDYTIVLVDNYETEEVVLKLNNGNSRNLKNLKQGNFVLWSGMTDTRELKFVKYYDESRTATQLVFNKIRVFNNEYSSENKTTQQDLDNAIKLYSLSINL